ncbi:protease inhibitor [Thozetella sp. PMI_491]|nr:protease inhibitor [Thozetella sp. PMI_491]
MAPYTESIKFALSELDKHKNSLMRVHFPDVTVNKPAVQISRTSAAEQPVLTVSSQLPNLSTAKKYIAACLDLDPPYPSMPVLGPLLHGIQADLQLESTEASKGWLALKATTKPVVTYVGPAPPPLSSPHRYLFLLWEQPEGLTGADIRTRLELPEEVGIGGRVRWNQEGFEKKAELGQVIAATYFVCS